jgi:hypothetical protein
MWFVVRWQFILRNVTVLGVVGNERISRFELETGKLGGVVGWINLVGFTEGDSLVLNL